MNGEENAKIQKKKNETFGLEWSYYAISNLEESVGKTTKKLAFIFYFFKWVKQKRNNKRLYIQNPEETTRGVQCRKVFLEISCEFSKISKNIFAKAKHF